MRLTILLLIISLGLKAQIPLDSIQSVSVYMFNLEVKDMKRPEIHIFQDGNWAKTAIPVEKPVTEEGLESLKKLLKKDLSTLQIGLSKCFIPRHGIIFYDAKRNPIGAISVCFECEGIRIWPVKEVEMPKKMKEKKALKQLDIIKSVIMVAGWPVYDSPREYEENLLSE